MIENIRVFPVRIWPSCSICAWRLSTQPWIAENLGGLQWIEDAAARSHHQDKPLCTGRPTWHVLDEESSDA